MADVYNRRIIWNIINTTLFPNKPDGTSSLPFSYYISDPNWGWHTLPTFYFPF